MLDEELGYVFLRSGAIETAQPELYPARRDHNLNFAFETMGEDDPRVCIEKSPIVTGLRSLPKLGIRLLHAVRNSDRVMIDDFTRIFLACPLESRAELLEQLWVFRHVFWELQIEGRALESLPKDRLAQLMHAQSRVKFRLTPRATQTRTEVSLKRQTARARLASARNRTAKGDAASGRIKALRDEMIAAMMSVTMQTVAIEASKRSLKTSRGRPWSASSVHRALSHGTKPVSETN